MPSPHHKDLVRRLATAAVGLPIVVGAIWLGQPWLDILVGLVALIGTGEALRLCRSAGLRPVEPLGIASAAGLVACASLGNPFHPGAVSGMVLATFAALLLRRGQANALADGAGTVTSALYAGGLVAFALPLRALPQGREWLLLALLATFAVDTAAYGVGTLLGRHRLAPAISPGKTWEGAMGGLAGGVGATLLLDAFLGLPLSWGLAIACGLAVGILAQVGDLAQSLLKRSAGVKDSGHILPGHGGVLDRLDSVVFVLPVVYYGVGWLGMRG
ncbi:MAG: phosphatidate cytidylyltransferase [Dehalococcoidia bacterium]|nr:phosphatidate cytidylyltransferase [Dehalococcoidia bacterium]MDW8119739.1 phosphatidate cytidylyltransferase [Chloroflexota bacterium]